MKKTLIAIAVLLCLPLVSYGQGVLVITNEHVRLPRPTPRPQEMTYAIEKLSVEGRISGQVADIQVSQTFRNSGSGTIQAQFMFPLPYDGAIDAMTLMVNGEELPARLMKADEARDRYQSIVRSQRDPALLEWVGTGMFQTSVFPIPAGETRTVSIHYSQLLRKDNDLAEFLFPMSTARYTSQPVQEVRVHLVIESETNLKNIYSPTHSIEIKRPTGKRATVDYHREHVIPDADFRLFFDAKQGDVSATLLTYRPDDDEDGYFLMLASPEFKADQEKQQAKTVMFVVDKSGSMSGKKIEQARDAAKFVLNNLHEGDLFNIIAYDSTITSFLPELEVYNKDSRAEALAYVEGLFAGGGTNIYDSLQQALKNLQDKKQPSYILFLTDGRPTSGETNESQIAAVAREANKVRARMLTFGVGFDVNSRLLDRLSRENHGSGEYVRPDEDIEEHVAKVYNRISSPVMTSVNLSFEMDERSPGKAVNRVYPGGELDLFAGEQLAIVGRYRKMGAVKIELTGSVQGQEQVFTFPGKFKKKSGDHSNSFIAKLWATRRIGELIDEIDLNGKNEELINELVMLSTKHGILTPYTSFLADETVRPELASDSNRRLTRMSLDGLSETSGESAFNQRGFKQQLKGSFGSDSATLSPVQNSSGSRTTRPTPRFNSGGGGGGFLGGSPSTPAPANRPLTTEPAAASGTVGRTAGSADEAAPVDVKEIVRKSDTQTVYKRGKLLVTPETASIDLEKDKKRITTIVRFSKEYFELTDANTSAENELLTLQEEGEELLVQLRWKIYLIK